MSETTARKRIQLAISIFIVVALGATITTLALMRDDEVSETVPTTPPALPTQSPLASTTQPTIQPLRVGNPGNPNQQYQPYQYDPINDQHWDPDHNHWHQGRPPTRDAAGTPTAWQYDPNTNQHWDPRHGHWHQGQPPPENQRQQQQQLPPNLGQQPNLGPTPNPPG